MAETLHSLEVTATIRGKIASADGIQQVVLWTKTVTFGDGSGTNQLQQLWWDKLRNIDTTSEDFDLNGTLTPVVDGGTLDLTGLKLVLLDNLDDDTGDYALLKQGSAAPMTTLLGGTSPTLKVGPGGFALVVSPVDAYTVTAGSADTLAVETADDSDVQLLFAGIAS